MDGPVGCLCSHDNLLFCGLTSEFSITVLNAWTYTKQGKISTKRLVNHILPIDESHIAVFERDGFMEIINTSTLAVVASV